MNHEEILSLRASGHVQRWHTIRTITQQTVAEHSGQALTLLLMLHPSPSMRLVKAMLWHDSAERVVGDAPSPGLRRWQGYKDMYERVELLFMEESHTEAYTAISQLSIEEHRWLRAIDWLEAYMQAQDEIKLGNRDFTIVQSRLALRLANEDTPTEVKSFFDWFVAEGYERSFA